MAEPMIELMTRRTLLLGASATVFAQAVLAQPALAQRAPTQGGELTPPEAHSLAVSGQITLIDVRRPDEWASTGSGEGAHRLDLRRDDFIPEVLKLVAGDPSAPVAVICARGVRSNRMSRALTQAGFTNVIDVPEGMLGSQAGPGWIARQLPLNRR
jgi:rhodanese-related sulfurtransferase